MNYKVQALGHFTAATFLSVALAAPGVAFSATGCDSDNASALQIHVIRKTQEHHNGTSVAQMQCALGEGCHESFQIAAECSGNHSCQSNKVPSTSRLIRMNSFA